MSRGLKVDISNYIMGWNNKHNWGAPHCSIKNRNFSSLNFTAKHVGLRRQKVGFNPSVIFNHQKPWQLQTMMGYTNGRRIRSSKNGMPHFMAMSIGKWWEQGMWDVQINPSGSTYWKGAFLQISLVRTPIVCKSFRLVTWIRIHPYDNWSKPNSGFHIKKNW